MLDLVIKGARICDGTGNPWYGGDVAVRGERIAAVGVVRARARRAVDGAGLVLCPGFVDVHTHSDGIVEHPAAENILRQGVTTVVSGNCGGSRLPVAAMLDRVEAGRPAVNYATLVGHGSVRGRVMGAAKRRPTRKESARMCRLVEAAMRDGAVGMSTGLFYVPGAYAQVDEIVAVAKVVAGYGGVYATHKRSAGGKLFQALREAATVGKRAGIAVEISHLKILHRRGRTRPDRVEAVLAAVERYRAQGVDMTCDVHPYPATFTGLSSVVIPPWCAKDGKLRERMRDAAVRRRIRAEVAGKIAWIGGPDRITIARFDPDPSLNGRSLADVAGARKGTAASVAMDLVAEGDPRCIFHALRPADVARIVCHPAVMIASDGGVVGARRGVVHPRNYGTFPRIYREYVRERRLLSLEEAVRKMTSLPARKFGIRDRGLIAPGMRADLVLFDPARIAERATFDAPHSFPAGIRAVVVNGHVAWDGKRVSRQRAGAVIRTG
ncbi:MAG: D-aminoacylase [Kiritimatiellae bacterium]|nr:D-aminoacylase [Kiritimatiellia bacterium]